LIGVLRFLFSNLNKLHVWFSETWNVLNREVARMATNLSPKYKYWHVVVPSCLGTVSHSSNPQKISSQVKEPFDWLELKYLGLFQGTDLVIDYYSRRLLALSGLFEKFELT
jgi:hypothetical protein